MPDVEPLATAAQSTASAGRDALSSLAGQLALAGSLFVGSVAIARALGPEARGAAYLALLIPTIGGVVASVGLPAAFLHRVGRDRREVGRALVVIHLATAAASVVAILLALVIPNPLARVLAVKDADLITAGVLITPLQLHLLLILGLMAAIGSLHARAAALVIQGLVYLALLLGLLLLGAGPMAVLVSQAVGMAAASVIGIAATIPRARRGEWRVSYSVLRWYVRFGLRSHPGNIGQYLNYRLDAFILGTFHGPTAVGVYAVATSLAEVASYAANAAALVAGARVSRANRRDVVMRTTRAAALVTIAIAVALGLGSPFVVPAVYGTAFSGSVTPLLFLLPGVVALAYVKILAVGLIGEGYPGTVTLGIGASLAATVSLDLLLIPKLAATGAALASTIAYGVGGVVLAVYYLRITGEPIRRLIPDYSDLRATRSIFGRG
jgi:O-antigen/teichoic acid export membrane protein